jgi:hypothetical protein
MSRILFLSETHRGNVYDKRMADTTPYLLPAGSQLLQDLGFQAFPLEGVDIIQPLKKPRETVNARTESGQSLGDGCASNMSIAVSNAAACSKRRSRCRKRGCATW